METSYAVVDFIFRSLVTFQQAGATAQSVTQPLTSSLSQFGQSVANAAPKIIAALVLLGIGLLIGRVIGWVVQKVAKKMNVDQHWNKTSIGESVSRSGWSLSRIIATAARWFVYLFFISAAVNVLEFQQLSQAINSVWLWIPNVIAFILVLGVGAILADFIGRWMQRELPARGVVGGKVIGMAATGILYAIVFAVAVAQLKIGEAILTSVISAMVWGIAAAIAIGVGGGLLYGLRDTFPALLRGSTQVMPALKPGQRVTLDGRSGTIEQAGSFSIILRDDSGKTVVIPTKNVIDKEIVIESGPKPETTEQKVESQTADLSTPSSFESTEAA